MAKRPCETAADPDLTSEMSGVADLALQASIEAGRLAQVAKLAAFAVEARRVLVAIDGAVVRRPEAASVLLSEVPCPNQWAEHDEVTDSVLRDVGYRLDEITETMDRLYLKIQAIGTRVEA